MPSVPFMPSCPLAPWIHTGSEYHTSPLGVTVLVLCQMYLPDSHLGESVDHPFSGATVLLVPDAYSISTSLIAEFAIFNALPAVSTAPPTSTLSPSKVLIFMLSLLILTLPLRVRLPSLSIYNILS